jgi:Peptidase A4 family
VGIDGQEGDGAGLVQAGVTWEVIPDNKGSFSVQYFAWYEWYPENALIFSNFAISAGDSITVNCQSSSSVAAKCSLQNHNTGKVVSATMTAPVADAALKGGHVSWVVEDYGENGGQVAFADFGSVDFSNCQAAAQPSQGNAGGTTQYDLSNALLSVLVDNNNHALTSVETCGSDMSVVYIG